LLGFPGQHFVGAKGMLTEVSRAIEQMSSVLRIMLCPPLQRACRCVVK
jgi:hypothetical protein